MKNKLVILGLVTIAAIAANAHAGPIEQTEATCKMLTLSDNGVQCGIGKTTLYLLVFMDANTLLGGDAVVSKTVNSLLHSYFQTSIQNPAAYIRQVVDGRTLETRCIKAECFGEEFLAQRGVPHTSDSMWVGIQPGTH